MCVFLLFAAASDALGTCPVDYQNDQCLGYVCNADNYQCESAGINGGGVELKECQQQCFPPTYECDEESGLCREVEPGFGTDLPVRSQRMLQLSISLWSRAVRPIASATRPLRLLLDHLRPLDHLLLLDRPLLLDLLRLLLLPPHLRTPTSAISSPFNARNLHQVRHSQTTSMS